MRQLTIAALISIAKQHLRILHEEHRIGYIGVSARHTPLHNDNLLALPRMQHRHTRNRTTRFQRDGINGIICANNEGDICIREVVIDLIHLEDNVVGNGCFSEKDVALPWHAACDWVNGKAHIDAFPTQALNEVSECVLCFRHGHAVTDYDDDVFCIDESFGCFFGCGLRYFALDLGLGLDCGSYTAEEDIGEGPVLQR